MKILQALERIKKIFNFFIFFIQEIHNFEFLSICSLYFALGIGIRYNFSFRVYDFILIVIFLFSVIIFIFIKKRFFLYLGILTFGIFYLQVSKFYNLKFFNKSIKNIVIEGVIDNIKVSRYKEYIILSNIKKNSFLNCDRVKLEKSKRFNFDNKIGDNVMLLINLKEVNYSDKKFNYYNKINNICGFGKIIDIIEENDQILFDGNIFAKFIKKLRKRIYNEISQNYKSSGSGILIALTIGNTGFIKKHDLENIRKVGIAHILAISGLHLSILSIFIFKFFRNSVIKILPFIALRYDVKKISIVPVIILLFIYLNLSGLSISAIRSFIMILLFFIGMIFDIKTSSVKILSCAFIISLAINPAYLFHPSFQMSFMAVLALIQSYEFINNYFIFHKIFPKIISYIINIELSSIAATFATAFFEIYHFQQYSMIGLVANPLILPIVEFFVLPIGFAGILIPFKIIRNYFYFLSAEIGGNIVVYISNFLIKKNYGFFLMREMFDLEISIISIGLILLFLATRKIKFFSIGLIFCVFVSYMIRTLLL